MATDNKQKVLIRSMSYDELENYLVNSDLNSKIIPKNEDTAIVMLSRMYYYWRNDMKLKYGKNFLTQVKHNGI